MSELRWEFTIPEFGIHGPNSEQEWREGWLRAVARFRAETAPDDDAPEGAEDT